MSRFFKSAAFPILIVVVLAFFAQRLISPNDEGSKPTYRDFQAQLQRGDLKFVELRDRDNTLEVTQRDGRKYAVGFTEEYGGTLQSQLIAAERADRIQDFDVKGSKSNGWLSLLTYVLPFLIFIGFWIFLMNQVQGGGSKVMSFGKSRAKRLPVDSPKITFRDVAGVDEAVEELHEIKEFLENPKKFQALGARIPKGVLLYGPPGTGKTLLARAVAGEAGVPFFSISGSDFVEMFVGVGASRVRDLFEQAKQNSPCIIFMDEIDAVGRQRGAGMGGGHDEREQTLNQLLVEMDGFDAKGGIIMIAATNRPDILDPALLRPGRFDRQIVVDRPDLPGREKILSVHTRGKPLGDDVEIATLARSTPGFTGADLANLVNEAALLAARHDKDEVNMSEMEEAIDRVIAGPERKTRLISVKEKEITAYHEAGHAIVGALLPDADPVHKITIIPRGQALGVTMSLPTEDRFMMSRGQLMAQLAMMLGGRAAERVKFDEITTGASNDLERVTQTSRQMVTRYGMSEKLGPMALGHNNGQVFMGRDFNSQPDYSDEIAFQIDKEIRRIVDESYDTAEDLLVRNRRLVEKLAQDLIEYETVDAKHLKRLVDECAVDRPPNLEKFDRNYDSSYQQD
ncbi:MAG: ATP-dependent zinc metalloprotease FtsH [Actinomycetota bacterium]|nr:ATP-dependent zinc metalloprotease FtsH [Actinomycetota bacterium]